MFFFMMRVIDVHFVSIRWFLELGSRGHFLSLLEESDIILGQAAATTWPRERRLIIKHVP